MDKFDAVMQSKIYSEMKGDDEIFNEFHDHAKTLIEDYEDFID